MHNNVVHLPDHSAEFRRCLVDCDVQAIQRLWKHVQPNMPAPTNDADALVCIHLARTATERLPFRFRAYSHAWLRERFPHNPSLLPDPLRPRAERMYPRVVSAVGICVASLSNRKSEYHHHVSGSMCNKVEEMYADGIEDPARIKAEMKVIHEKCRKQR